MNSFELFNERLITRNISTENFKLDKICHQIRGILRSWWKLAYEEYPQTKLPVFFFLPDLSLLNVKISRAYN